jgi:anti-anti-sigma factor
MADSLRSDSHIADSHIADSHITGHLDVTTAADLRAELVSLLERDADAHADIGARTDLIVDLSAVDAVDMVGVGLLVGVHRQAQRHGRRLVLTGVPPRVMRLLTATRLRRVLAVRDLPRSRSTVVIPDDAARDLPRANAG